ncbi:MAG: monofunctional biosynthetic peptidoglycan transglycosylase, partial [Terriglobales bacterium]
MTATSSAPAKRQPRTHPLRALIQRLLIGILLLWSLAALTLASLRWIDPPTTAVHIQRRLQAWT